MRSKQKAKAMEVVQLVVASIAESSFVLGMLFGGVWLLEKA